MEIRQDVIRRKRGIEPVAAALHASAALGNAQVPRPEKVGVLPRNFSIQQLLANPHLAEHACARGGIKSCSARLINGILFAAVTQLKFIESARVNDGVAADRMTAGKKAAYIREVLSKKKALLLASLTYFVCMKNVLRVWRLASAFAKDNAGVKEYSSRRRAKAAPPTSGRRESWRYAPLPVPPFHTRRGAAATKRLRQARRH